MIDSWAGHEMADESEDSVGLSIHTAGNRIQIAMTEEEAAGVGAFLIEASGYEPEEVLE